MRTCEHNNERECSKCMYRRGNLDNYRRKRQKKLDAVLARGGKCEDCGYDIAAHPETGDFVRGDQYPSNLPIPSTLLWQNATQFLKVIEYCDLLCANCNRIRTAEHSQSQT